MDKLVEGEVFNDSIEIQGTQLKGKFFVKFSVVAACIHRCKNTPKYPSLLMPMLFPLLKVRELVPIAPTLAIVRCQ